MVNLIDVVIIAIALMAALGALLLLRPQVDRRDALKIRKLRTKAEKDQQMIAQVLNTIQHGARDTEYLSSQLKARVEQINRENQNSHTRAEEAERAIEKAIEAENELRSISTQLGERIQYVQTYWDEQLGDTSETVKQVQTKLKQGLNQVDEGLLRLREQEKMAQGFTQKLLEHQKEHLASQQKNAQLSGEVHTQLETMLRESTASLQTIQEQNKQSDTLFKKYSDEILGLEQQAHEQFAEIFQTTDVARTELNTSLSEARKHTAKLQEYEEEGQKMSGRIQDQFEKVDHLQVDRLTKTVSLTDEMCENLQEGLENARDLLATLEAKTTEVINAKDEEEAPALAMQDNSESAKPRNLFSLRAYR